MIDMINQTHVTSTLVIDHEEGRTCIHKKWLRQCNQCKIYYQIVFYSLENLLISGV